MTTEAHDTIAQAAAIIERFGGIRPMSSKTGVPVTTIQGWKQRDAIPRSRVKELSEAAMLHHIDLGDLLSPTNQQEAPPIVEEAVVVEQVAIPVPPVIKERRAAPEAVVHPRHSGVLMAAGVIIFAAAALGAVIAVTPEVRKLSAQEQRIKDLELEVQKLEAVEKTNTPSALGTQIESLKNKVSDLTDQAKYYAAAIEDLKTGTMAQRVNKLEGHMNHLLEQAHATSLQNMLNKVEAMQASVTGSQDLQQVLGAVLGVVGDGSKIDEVGSNSEKLTNALESLRISDPKVAAAFKDVPPEDMRAAVMLMGMAQLRNSLARDNTSFDQDLKILKMTAAKDDPSLQEAIDRLAPKAKSGVLTPDGLSKQLRGLTGEIVAASLSGEDISIQDKAIARLEQMVKVEKGGRQINGTDTQVKISEAQKKLDAGDVEGAVAILSELQGPAAAKTKPFLEQAQDTIMAGRLQQMLGTNIMGTLRNMVGGGPAYTTSGGGIIGKVKSMVPQELKQKAGF